LQPFRGRNLRDVEQKKGRNDSRPEDFHSLKVKSGK